MLNMLYAIINRGTKQIAWLIFTTEITAGGDIG